MSATQVKSLVIRAVWWKKTSLQVEISFINPNLLYERRDLASIFRQIWRSREPFLFLRCFWLKIIHMPK